MKEFGFNTSKKEFKDGLEVFPIKEFVFAHCTIDDIVDEFSKNGVEINIKDLLEKYEKCYHLQDVLDDFENKYGQQVEEIEDKDQLFDSDAFFYLMHRLIEENYDVSTLPDPDMIATGVFNNKDIRDENKPKCLLDFLVLVNKIRNYTDEKNLQNIFDSTGLYVGGVIDEYSSIAFRKDVVNKTISTKLVRELLNLTEYYELDDNKHYYSLAMDFAGIYGFNSIKKILDKAINRYPESEIRFLVNAVTSISEKDKERNNLVNKIRQLQPKTIEDHEYLDILSEWVN